MDTVANLLTIIRNGYLVGKSSVVAPFSKFGKAILDVLVKEGYIQSVKLVKDSKIAKLEVQLKYQGKKPAITGIVKVSKPGRRIYRRGDKLPKTLSGLGTTVVSTSKGVMTETEAKKKNLGGEVVCQVW